jgi:putative heme-binding domain-containing protein
MSRRLRVLVHSGCLTLFLTPVAFAQTRPAAGPTDLAAGQRIFDAQCAWCHGNGGDGGAGPNLHGKLLHATTAGSIVDIINKGIPGTDMPSFRLTERETRQTATYVMSLSRTVARPGPGNAERGGALYQSNGCGSCHVVDGRGGILGPELSGIGGRRGSVYLREAIVKPAARIHPATSSSVRYRRAAPRFAAFVSTRTCSGSPSAMRAVRCTRFENRPVANRRELEGTLMPSYESRLSAPQLDDLVAYLATLRGAK